MSVYIYVYMSPSHAIFFEVGGGVFLKGRLRRRWQKEKGERAYNYFFFIFFCVCDKSTFGGCHAVEKQKKVSVLLSESVERFFVSRRQDF